MKKTVNINLNSFMFNIDEDAYKMLSLYLSKLEEHFAKLEESNEIVRDIEARIAEIFNMRINENKQVINITDVEEVVLILGNVEDITGEDMSEQSSETKSTDKKKKAKKKLYRDSENKQLAGICSGLSHYTGISTTTWRVLFLIFLFIGQISIIAYLILWIAVPEATTTAEKIEMKGDKVNLSNIEKTVKEEYDNLKKNFKNIDTKKASDTLNNIGKAFLNFLSITARVLGKIIGVAFLVGGALVIVALTIGLISVSKENIYFTNDFISMIWLPGLLEYVTNSATAWLLSISILVFCIIPVLAIIYWGLILLFNIKSNKYLSIGTFMIWILSIIIIALTSLNIGAAFRSVDNNNVHAYIPCDSSKNYSFNLSSEFSDNIIMNEDDIDNIDDIHLYINQHLILPEEGKLRSLPEIDFHIGTDTCAEIQFIYYSRGANRKEAKINLEKIKYNYNITDSIVYFDPYFIIDSKRFRAQNLKIKVYIPEGHTFTIDKSLSKIIDIEDATKKHEDEELTGKLLMATKSGFIII
ncbi:MAG: PspC domain-containing protein [Bacteroidales bacterium]|nr:PspC domain-containing protein [Bacteroidales bacterium]